MGNEVSAERQKAKQAGNRSRGRKAAPSNTGQRAHHVNPKVSGASPENWPAETVELWPIEKLTPYARNPRTHDPSQVGLIADNMRRKGWTSAVLIDETGQLIVGHGRVMAATKLAKEGLEKFAYAPVMMASGWSDQDKQEQRIWDNQIATRSGWNEDLLKLEIMDLKNSGLDLNLLGFPELELMTLGVLENEQASELGQENRHALLRLVDITIDDPKHQVSRGDHYMLSGKHHLFVVSVISEWRRWHNALQDGVLFAPYAGVFVPFSEKAADNVLLMVQPDPYIAGHILDRYSEVHGKRSIKKIEAAHVSHAD